MFVNGWKLLFHGAIVDKVRGLVRASQRARKSDPENFRSNTNVRLLAALTNLMVQAIPSDPGRAEYRQGGTLGKEYRHWFRAKFFGRYRLFFRYDSRTRVIVYTWFNDEHTLRQSGSKRDPYGVFRRMLLSGNPPDDWAALVKASEDMPDEILRAMMGPGERE